MRPQCTTHNRPLGRYRYFCGSELDDRFVSGLNEGPKTAKRNERFRSVGRKPLKSFRVLNQRLRRIVCFQGVNQHFVSPFFSRALSHARGSAASTGFRAPSRGRTPLGSTDAMSVGVSTQAAAIAARLASRPRTLATITIIADNSKNGNLFRSFRFPVCDRGLPCSSRRCRRFAVAVRDRGRDLAHIPPLEMPTWSLMLQKLGMAAGRL
jgi:hypothetical protein